VITIDFFRQIVKTNAEEASNPPKKDCIEKSSKVHDQTIFRLEIFADKYFNLR
jgi:hypothetical protein